MEVDSFWSVLCTGKRSKEDCSLESVEVESLLLLRVASTPSKKTTPGKAMALRGVLIGPSHNRSLICECLEAWILTVIFL